MNPRLRKDIFALLNASTSKADKADRLIRDLADVWDASEVKDELRKMEAAGFLTSAKNAAEETVWRLTGAGVAAARELGL